MCIFLKKLPGKFATSCLIVFFFVVTPVLYGAESYTFTTGTDHILISGPASAPDRICVQLTREKDPDQLLFRGDVSAVPKATSPGRKQYIISGLRAEHWSPASPVMYDLMISTDKHFRNIEVSDRIGFRSIESREGRIWLNGYPLFLRGIAINPPGRGIPETIENSREFALEYVRFMKSMHVNIIRIPDNEVWYDVCDELGMMVFGGNYSGSVMGQRPPADYDAAVDWYKEKKFGPIMHHPSLVIYALTNEVPYRGSKVSEWIEFLNYAYAGLQKWDPSRLYIGNAGYGYGQSGDICDLHRYWGWYYASPFTFLHIRDYERITFPDKVQPLTFTECVGNYTGPDGRYNLTPNHKNPVSQLNWTGHAPQQVQQLLADQHQSWTLKQATELTRRLRRINSESSGIFPFTILFRNWHTATSFVDMDPKPAIRQVRESYQPVLVSWENWRHQVYAGTVIDPIAHVINDSEDFSALKKNKLVVRLLDNAMTVRYVDTISLPDIAYFDIHSERIPIRLPLSLFTGDYTLEGILFSGGREVSRNHHLLYISSRAGSLKQAYSAKNGKGESILLYDPAGTTKTAFQARGIPVADYIPGAVPGSSDLLIIGKNSADSSLAAYNSEIRNFVAEGGRLFILPQDSFHQAYLTNMLPVQIQFPEMDIDDPRYPPPDRPSRNGFNINPERPGHPVFEGISRKELRIWSDYTQWDETQSGMPAIYPVANGFVLRDPMAVKQTAILANYSVGLEGIALAEIFDGKGSILLSGFDLVNRLGKDPVADRIMQNCISYMMDSQGHEPYVFVDAPITWGAYGTEKGVLTGIYSGLMINAKPALVGSYEDLEYSVDVLGHGYAGAKWGWNNRAGKQYVPYGRRIFGPYYHRDFGGVATPLDPDSENGEAFFWCRVHGNTSEMYNLVWNPADEPAKVTIAVNGTATSALIRPGAYQSLQVPVDGSTGELEVMLTGDRRLVLLETVFY